MIRSAAVHEGSSWLAIFHDQQLCDLVYFCDICSLEIKECKVSTGCFLVTHSDHRIEGDVFLIIEAFCKTLISCPQFRDRNQVSTAFLQQRLGMAAIATKLNLAD